MARRLRTIVEINKDIKENDTLYFNFKTHTFRAQVSLGGLIHRCIWTQPNKDPINIFPGRTFESLTDWTETCIQEKLQEYHTRYSAWRRVRHEKSGKTMEEIYKAYTAQKLFNNVNKLSNTEYQTLVTHQHESILKHKEYQEKLQKAIKQWEEWFNGKYPDTEIPVKNIKTPVEPPKQIIKHQGVQPIVLDSPNGTYVVLQRVANTGDKETINKIKGMGLTGFRNIVSDFMKKHTTWTPPSDKDNEPQWYQKNVKDALADPQKAARYVHEFFKN